MGRSEHTGKRGSKRRDGKSDETLERDHRQDMEGLERACRLTLARHEGVIEAHGLLAPDKAGGTKAVLCLKEAPERHMGPVELLALRRGLEAAWGGKVELCDSTYYAALASGMTMADTRDALTHVCYRASRSA